MGWFRNKVWLGSRLALLALALQLALSFGHVHAALPATAVAQAGSAIGPVAPDHDDDSAVDLCAICVVLALANSALVAAPPALPLPQAFACHRRSDEADRAAPAVVRLAFQPRAPPLS